jgi:predicted kinase
VLYVVTGPPTAGKSSWIRARAKPSDIVIDMDLLAQALAGPGITDRAYSDILLKVTHRARFAAIDEACRHLDEVDVYLIHTMPSPKARAKYRRLGASIVVLDPGRDLVMQRVQAMRQPGMEAVARRWYDGYAKHSRSRAHTVTVQSSRPW